MSLSAIAPSSEIVEGTNLGHYCVVADGVRIGRGCEIGSHVVLHEGTIVGEGVRIDDGTIVGKQPMRAANTAVSRDDRQIPALIGDRCLIGAGVVIYAGSQIGERVLVADLATIRERVEIGDFSIVGRGVAVENDCRIGRYCKLETNAYITAYSLLEDRVFVAPGVLTSNDNFLGRTQERFKHFGGVTVRRGGRVGVGAVILPGKELQKDAVVAAGAVLTGDAEAQTIYAGIPARRLRAVPPEQLLDNQGWEE
jgi:acetyltransferase-like isoleucine patch superfamily enzyme